MAIENVTGATANVGDCFGLAESIYNVLTGPDLSLSCRNYAIQNLQLDIQGSRYKDLFNDILKKHQETESPTESPKTFPETRNFKTSVLEKNFSELVDMSKARKNNLLTAWLSRRSIVGPWFEALYVLTYDPKLFVKLTRRWIKRRFSKIH